MSTANPTLASIATEARGYLKLGSRTSEDTGRPIVCAVDDAPDWIASLCRAAHGNMLPDDYRYEAIAEALDTIGEADDEDDAQRRCDEWEAPIYNAERTRWLASHVERAGYCDEACEEYGAGPDVGVLDRIALGYLAEWREVFQSVLDSLKAEMEARKEAAEEAQS